MKTTLKIWTLLIGILSINIAVAQDIIDRFPEEAMANKLYTTDGKTETFEDVLAQYKGKPIMIDIWASWCKDCIGGIPKVKKLQEEHPNIVFLFLSVDEDGKEAAWTKAIEKYELTGEHYRIVGGWKSDLCSSIDLDWIPRYMIVDSEGNILHYKSIEANDEKLEKLLADTE